MPNGLLRAEAASYDAALRRVIKKAEQFGDVRCILHWNGVVGRKYQCGVDPKDLQNGLYKLFWHSGGSSLAAVGRFANGDCWYTACNHTQRSKSTDWSDVLRVEPVEAD